MTLSGNKKILFFLVISFIFYTKAIYALDNKIVIKIDNSIITKIDIENEIRYLKALNPNLKNLNVKEIYLISKNSLIREKIKELEIYKYIKEITIERKFLESLIKARYTNLNFNNKEIFLDYLKTNMLEIKDIENKLSIEATWNQLIYQKFSKNIKINKKQLADKIKRDNSKKLKSYMLSEILFNANSKKDLDDKYNLIISSISDNGFENTALSFSVSDSSNIGGKLGWIKENSLNKIIKKELSSLNIDQITKPIFTPSGYLILKINDLKLIDKNYDQEKQLKDLINYETNQQLNQFSNNYFKKIKNNFIIDEIQ